MFRFKNNLTRHEFNHLLSLASTGDAEAQYTLGLHYNQDNRMAPTNSVKAITYFQLAATQGHVAAAQKLEELANYYHSQGEFYTKMSLEENSQRRFQRVQAESYYGIAADAGHSDAQVSYGQTLSNEEAVMYYQMSAELNNAKGQYELAQCYYNGKGIQKDLVCAVRYYTLAAEQNHEEALYYLKVCYILKQGFPNNGTTQEAIDYYKTGAKLGFSYASYQLAEIYEYGLMGKKDLERAIEYYLLASHQNHRKAKEKAFQLCNAQGGSRVGMNGLGMCNQKGFGTPVDEKKAAKYYRLAAEQGSTDAKKNLDQFFEGTNLFEKMTRLIWGKDPSLIYHAAMTNKKPEAVKKLETEVLDLNKAILKNSLDDSLADIKSVINPSEKESKAYRVLKTFRECYVKRLDNKIGDDILPKDIRNMIFGYLIPEDSSFFSAACERKKIKNVEQTEEAAMIKKKFGI